MTKLKMSRIIIAIAILVIFSGFLTNIHVLAKNKGDTYVNIKVGKKTFIAVFYDNKTADALLKKMPEKYKMSELNGNEKYRYLKYSLPVREQKMNRIKAGDIMLYGSDCLVLFYKSFPTTYSYTRIGRITDTRGLKKAVGKGKVSVSLSKMKKKK